MKCSRKILSAFFVTGFLLGGCDQVDQQELLAKVKGLTTPNEIVAAIGPADEIEVEGAQAFWLYKARGRDVCFIIAGKMAMRMSC